MIANFTNANSGNNLNDKKSMEGLNFKIGSMPFTWSNKKQKIHCIIIDWIQIQDLNGSYKGKPYGFKSY